MPMLITLPKPSRAYDVLALSLATLGPAGRMRPAPGTWGSLVAVILAPVLFLPWSMGGRMLVLALIFPFGSWCASRAEQILGRKDPGSVVIDELWGQWITLLPLGSGVSDWPWLLVGLVLFRFFDIGKPWPVHASEHWLPRGWGIMIDDGFAGLYAVGFMTLAHFLF